MGTCHSIPGRKHHTPLPEAEQRKLGHIVLTGLLLTAASGGMGTLAMSGRAIQLSVNAQRAVRNVSLAVKNSVRVTWVVTSDMATKAVVATAPVTLNPRTHQSIIDFSTSLFPGPPAANFSGMAGAIIGNRTAPEEWLR